MSYQLRDYQEEAVESIFDYFNEPSRAHSLEEANPLVCMPTGSGKSLVIGEFIKRAMIRYPGTRVFMSTHVKELIKQNAAKLQSIWPQAPLGINSAGMKRRDTEQPIIFAGVQSVAKRADEFGKRDLLVVDEAHLMGPSADTSYGMLRDGLKKRNPYLRTIGLTATHYRLGLGLMTNGPIFTDIAYNLCTMDGFARLIADGYLCPLIAQPTVAVLDTSKVGVSNGEYKQGELQAAVDDPTVTFEALRECCIKASDRWSWLLFASGVEHAEHIGAMLNEVFGVTCVVIHSKKTEAENEASLLKWQRGEVRAAVNMNSLTTGVDHPACDFIAMLRPTLSTGLWVQMLGRGTRPYSYLTCNDPIIAAAFPFVKANCLVLDFAGNTRRLGPINDPLIPRPRGSGPPGDSPVKRCGKCSTYNHTSARSCLFCGEPFPAGSDQPNINAYSSSDEVMRSGNVAPEYVHFARWDFANSRRLLLRS